MTCAASSASPMDDDAGCRALSGAGFHCIIGPALELGLESGREMRRIHRSHPSRRKSVENRTSHGCLQRCADRTPAVRLRRSDTRGAATSRPGKAKGRTRESSERYVSCHPGCARCAYPGHVGDRFRGRPQSPADAGCAPWRSSHQPSAPTFRYPTVSGGPGLGRTSGAN
jgi:hypothetical protein